MSETGAVVTAIGESGFHLVTNGDNAQVTVNNRGDLLCPPVIRADDVDDLVGALITARDVALQQRAAHEEPPPLESPATKPQARRAASP